MDRAIDFYFDFTSPYSYLASTQIEDIAARHGRTVRWHPVLLAGLTEATGVKLTPFVPIKFAYALKDLARGARLRGVPFAMPQDFPKLWLNPPRAFLWVRSAYGEDQARAFAQRVFAKAFGEGVGINDVEVLAEVAAQLDIDPDGLRAGVHDDEVKAALKFRIETALANGVFGVPFMVADGEAWWGADRVRELDEFLASQEAAVA